MNAFSPVVLLTLGWSICAHAGEAPKPKPAPTTAPKPASSGPEVCPNDKKLGQLCGLLHANTKHDDELSEAEFVVESAACVTADDSQEQMQAKVQALWAKYEAMLKCNGLSFGVVNGSVLKFAVSRRRDAFIEAAAEVWRIDLNRADEDGQTLLDYVDAERRGTGSNAVKERLDYYYQLLTKAGAKHSKPQRSP